MDTSIGVNLGSNSYNIHVGQGVLERTDELITALFGCKACFVITDENVGALYGDEFVSSLKQNADRKVNFLTLPFGEHTKSLSQLEKILEWMVEHGADRGSVVIALGGGVVGDISGVAASLYMRGVKWVQVPTTLLAQIDSSIGGKTAVNLKTGKNLVGSFHQPSLVLTDTATLKTLPHRELLAGYAEGIKHSIITDRELFFDTVAKAERIIALEDGCIDDFIISNCKIKAAVVEEDEKESGKRKLLNFGHSFGHVIETVCEYNTEEILHGEAVAVGMKLAFDLSVDVGLCQASDRDAFTAHMKHLGMKTEIREAIGSRSLTASEYVEIMRKDKKNKDGKLSLILSKGIGEAFVSDGIDENHVIKVVERSLNS